MSTDKSKRIRAGFAVAVVILTPFIAQFLTAIFAYAPASDAVVKFSLALFWPQWIQGLLWSYGLFLALALIAHYVLNLIEPAGEGAMVLLANILLPPFSGVGLGLLFYALSYCDFPTQYLHGAFILAWILFAPVFALLAWFLLGPVYMVLSRVFAVPKDRLMLWLVSKFIKREPDRR